MKQLLFMLTVSAVLLSACGAKAPPTVDPVQVQASALAAAGTMIAQTQAAIPPTPAPSDTPQPTPTELASPTPLTLPTLSSFPTAEAPTASGTGSNCNGALASKPAGPLANVKIQNSTKFLVTISLYLIKNKFGDCGYRSYVIAAMQSVSTTSSLPYGCYDSYAFSQDPKKPFHVSSGPDCITGPDKTTFNIQLTILKVTGP